MYDRMILIYRRNEKYGLMYLDDDVEHMMRTIIGGGRDDSGNIQFIAGTWRNVLTGMTSWIFFLVQNEHKVMTEIQRIPSERSSRQN